MGKSELRTPTSVGRHKTFPTLILSQLEAIFLSTWSPDFHKSQKSLAYLFFKTASFCVSRENFHRQSQSIAPHCWFKALQVWSVSNEMFQRRELQFTACYPPYLFDQLWWRWILPRGDSWSWAVLRGAFYSSGERVCSPDKRQGQIQDQCAWNVMLYWTRKANKQASNNKQQTNKKEKTDQQTK